MDYEKTGKFLQELRKENSLTQLALAERLGVTDRAVSKWERGKGFPDVSLLKPLAEVLGVSVSELLEGERRPADREVCLPDGSAALSVSEADTVAMKGIRAYVHDARRKTAIWKSAFAAVLVLLVLAMLLAAGSIWQYAHTPVDFQKNELNFQRICMVSGGTVVEEIDLEGSLGEEFRSQVQGLLREILMERVEYRGFLLPKEYEEVIAIELEGLATFYPGAYYDHKSEKYYTLPYIEPVYRQLSGMCADKLEDETYQYEGAYEFSCDGRTLTLACTPTEKPMERIIDLFRASLKDAPDPGETSLQDAWAEHYRIENIRRLSPEQYRDISEFQYGLQKEIPYRNLCDYRIYQVTYSFTRKPEAPWGFQYPDDTTYDMLVMTAKKTFVDDDYDILPEYLSVPFEIMS